MVMKQKLYSNAYIPGLSQMQPAESFPELQTFIFCCSTDENKAYLVPILEGTNSILFHFKEILQSGTIFSFSSSP